MTLIFLKSGEANFWVFIPILLVGGGIFYMSYFNGRTEHGESIQVKFLRKFFGKQDNLFGNIFTNERTTTLPNFFKGAALAATGMRFTSNRSYSELQINNMVENYISKLINNKVKRFPIEHVEEFIEVQSRIVEKLLKYKILLKNILTF